MEVYLVGVRTTAMMRMRTRMRTITCKEGMTCSELIALKIPTYFPTATIVAMAKEQLLLCVLREL